MKTCSVILLNRSTEISALSSGKIDKCENLTGCRNTTLRSTKTDRANWAYIFSYW